MILIRDLRKFLIGKWKLKRDVENHLTNEIGKLNGYANFSPMGDGTPLYYGERGEFYFGQLRFESFQNYIFEFPQLHNSEVLFRNRKKFHTLDLSHGKWNSIHNCSADRYSGLFNVRNLDNWSSIWEIRGPKKNSKITSNYIRACT